MSLKDAIYGQHIPAYIAPQDLERMKKDKDLELELDELRKENEELRVMLDCLESAATIPGTAIVTLRQLESIERIDLPVGDSKTFTSECPVCQSAGSRPHLPGCWIAKAIANAQIEEKYEPNK